jgi:methanogenic corrinoid protein MtbC1
MSDHGHIDPLALLIAELDEDAALENVRQRMAAGEDAPGLLRHCERGMLMVGDRYQEGVYYISGLIIGGEICREAVEILQPHLDRHVAETGEQGTVLLCTVKGDIHDIGKNIVAALLRASGYRVVDLGVDVDVDAVVRAVGEVHPDVVGLSGLLSHTQPDMKRVIEQMRLQPGPVSGTPVIIGGGATSETVREAVGADAWCADAVRAVPLIGGLVSATRSR